MKRFKFIKTFFYFLAIFITLVACNDQDSTAAYKPGFAVDTSGNKTLIWGFPSFSYCENAQLLVKYLNKRLSGAHIVVKACVSYEEYLENLSKSKFDLTVINGIVALDKESKDYFIVGKIKDDSQYSGVIFTRKDADVKKVNDLKEKKISLVPHRTIPATLMTLYYLYQHGLDVNRDILRVNVASFESAIITTYVGKSEAGLCLKRNWNVYVKQHPEILKKVEVKWETPPLINNALLIKNTTDTEIAHQLSNLFFSIQTTEEGKTALSQLDISGFEKANDNTFKPMKEFKKKYDAVIH